MSIPYDVNQADWGHPSPYGDGTLDPWVPDKWVIHYGGGPNDAGGVQSVDKEIAVLRSWRNWHVDGRGWADIAYNYAIGQTGTIYRLRGENRAGATSGDYENDGIPENHEARAVVFILGGDQKPTEQALDAFRRLWRAEPLPVVGHRQVRENSGTGSSTACPGSHLIAFIDSRAYTEGQITFDDLQRVVERSERRVIRTLMKALLKGEFVQGSFSDTAAERFQRWLDQALEAQAAEEAPAE